MADHSESPSAHQESGGGASAVSAVVKWFNPTKGFGFVQPAGQSRDAFLHVSVCQDAGLGEVQQGTVLSCSLEERERGLQVTAVHGIESLPEGDPEPRPSTPRRHDRGETGPEREVGGTVKFYNGDKGFGFVVPDDGGPDIFIAGRLLARCGIHDLVPGQALQLKAHDGPKGPVASWLQLV